MVILCGIPHVICLINLFLDIHECRPIQELAIVTKGDKIDGVHSMYLQLAYSACFKILMIFYRAGSSEDSVFADF